MKFNLLYNAKTRVTNYEGANAFTMSAKIDSTLPWLPGV